MGQEESSDMVFNRNEIIKLLTIIVAIVGSWYQVTARINTLERESASIIEFKLLAQEVSAQDEDQAQIMKVTNQILSDVQDIKIRLARLHGE